MSNHFIAQAISILAPNASWSMEDYDYGRLVWISDDVPKPSILEVEAKAAELKAAEPMRLLRRERDRLIAETDWWVMPDRTPTDEQLAYRQALRDLPTTATPVLDGTTKLGISGVTWPTKP
jgi:hypothetical protein